MFDAIVIGGSYAGMAAALQLVRARRKVMVIDAGARRNRFASASHGLIGQDGRAPDAIFADAKAQLLRYPTLTWYDGTAASAERGDSEFGIRTGEGERFQARCLVLATGVRDELPPVPGLQERWGQAVFHCPYCHGYELEQGPVGVLAVGEISMHQALLLPEWGNTTFFINGSFDPTEEQLSQLKSRGVTVERERVVEVAGARADVHLADGRIVPLAGIFVASRIHVMHPVLEQLGCALTDGPTGAFVQTDANKETSVPGVFACGDMARGAHSLSFAIGDGAMTGAAAHRMLVFGALK